MRAAWVTALPHVYDAYRWRPVRVTKVRGIIRVETNKESFALKPISAGEDRLAFLDRAHQYLQKQAYTHLLPWQQTKYGDMYFYENGAAFYASPWFGREWSRDSAISDDALVQSLAEMHRLTEKTDLKMSAPEVASLAMMAKQWQKHTERLRTYAETAQKKAFAAPFEKVLLARVDELEQAAFFAIKGLKHMFEKEEKKPFRRVFCHRRVHPHNLVYKQNRWKWIDFVHADIDVPVCDLALYMQNFPIDDETDDDQQLEKLHARLAAYETAFPLHLREKQLLCLFLAYPRNVIKLLDRYYRRQQARDEMNFVERLEGTVRYFQVVKRFIKQLWPRGNR